MTSATHCDRPVAIMTASRTSTRARGGCRWSVAVLMFFTRHCASTESVHQHRSAGAQGVPALRRAIMQHRCTTTPLSSSALCRWPEHRDFTRRLNPRPPRRLDWTARDDPARRFSPSGGTRCNVTNVRVTEHDFTAVRERRPSRNSTIRRRPDRRLSRDRRVVARGVRRQALPRLWACAMHARGAVARGGALRRRAP